MLGGVTLSTIPMLCQFRLYPCLLVHTEIVTSARFVPRLPFPIFFLFLPFFFSVSVQQKAKKNNVILVSKGVYIKKN